MSIQTPESIPQERNGATREDRNGRIEDRPETVEVHESPSTQSVPTFPLSGSSLWGSIVSPIIKKLWEVPTIQLSTYYGSPNQPGRPVRRNSQAWLLAVYLSVFSTGSGVVSSSRKILHIEGSR